MEFSLLVVKKNKSLILVVYQKLISFYLHYILTVGNFPAACQKYFTDETREPGMQLVLRNKKVLRYANWVSFLSYFHHVFDT